MFFDHWMGLLRVIVVGTIAYAALVVFLRITGNRTLSKMNAFDLVVTVALGSTLATVLLTKDVALAEGLLAFALLIGLQYVVAWLSVRFVMVRRVVKSEPKLLFHRGDYLRDAMRAARVTEAEVRAAVRESGMGNLESVAAVVLESNGTFTVLKDADAGSRSALQGVAGHEAPA